MNARRNFLRAIGTGALPVSVALSAGAAHAQNTSDGVFEGTWFFENIPGMIPGLPPELQAGPFSEMILFGPAGIATETNSELNANSFVPGDPSPINLSASDGMGSWRRTSPRQIEALFYKFLSGAQGAHVGYLKVAGVLETDGSRLIANWVVDFQFFNPQLPKISAGVRGTGTRV